MSLGFQFLIITFKQRNMGGRKCSQASQKLCPVHDTLRRPGRRRLTIPCLPPVRRFLCSGLFVKPAWDGGIGVQRLCELEGLLNLDAWRLHCFSMFSMFFPCFYKHNHECLARCCGPKGLSQSFVLKRGGLFDCIAG